jgi:hypothetical protein
MIKYSSWCYAASVVCSAYSLVFESVPALIIGLMLALAGIAQEGMEI